MKIEYGAGNLIVPTPFWRGVYLTPYKEGATSLKVGKTYFLANEAMAKELLGYESEDAA